MIKENRNISRFSNEHCRNIIENKENIDESERNAK